MFRFHHISSGRYLLYEGTLNVTPYNKYWPVVNIHSFIHSLAGSLVSRGITVHSFGYMFRFHQIYSGQYLLYEGTFYVPSYNKYWPEDGLMKPKHVVKTMYSDYSLMCCDWIKYFYGYQFYLFIVKMLGEKYKLWRSLMCNIIRAVLFNNY